MMLRAAVTLAALWLALPLFAQTRPDMALQGATPFTQTILTTGLESPWELTLGPDGFLWVTERSAGRITRISTADGSKHPAIELQGVSARSGQAGLLGLALHPDLLQGKGRDFVYAAHTYRDAGRGPGAAMDAGSNHAFIYARIIRLTWDPASETLGELQTIIEGLPAGGDHNSGRLKIGPDLKLYYTIGDMGNGQFANMCLPIRAQQLPTADELSRGDFFAYQGKSLRLNLDGSVPDDNPELNGVRSHVFTYGHRNMQGLAFAPDGRLYASEQGPKTDDEVNLLREGANYGWPHVAGFRDDMAYVHARWWDAAKPCPTLSFSDLAIDPSVPVTDETAWTEPMQEPLATLFTVPDDWNFSEPACNGADFICWPTVAPSSIETYMPATGGIPGWQNSLLVTTLKRGSLYLVPLGDDGQTPRGPVERYFQSENRYRDLAVSPDHRTIYIATDSGGMVGTMAGGATDKVANPGAILVFEFAGAP